MNDSPKKEIDEIINLVEPSSIPLQIEKEDTKILINLDKIAETVWGDKSASLQNDYKFGKGAALFGENEMSLYKFFKRFGNSFCSIINNELSKKGQSSESLKPLYNIFENALLLISREIDKKDLKDLDIHSIIASLQGFVINYSNKKENNNNGK